MHKSMFHARTRTDRRLDFWTLAQGTHEKANLFMLFIR